MSAEEVWNHKIPNTGPEAKKGQTQPAKWALSQARSRATDAEGYARAAHSQAKRNRAAIAAMANSLAPDVRKAVIDALGDEISVTLTIDKEQS